MYPVTFSFLFCNSKWDYFLSFSDSSLLVYKNATNFWMLILHIVTLPNSFICSSNFLLEYYIQYHLWIMSYNSSFSIWMPFLFVWLLWLGLPVLFWIKEMKVDIPVLFLILRETLVVFAHWVWCWQWVCHIWPLWCWGMFLPFSLAERFCHKSVLDFIKCFFCIYW